MTPDEAVADALERSSVKSGMTARYAVRRNSRFFGHVEAHLNTHGSHAPQDWDLTWNLTWQNDDGSFQERASEDLEALLQPFGDVDLALAMASAPGFGSGRQQL